MVSWEQVAYIFLEFLVAALILGGVKKLVDMVFERFEKRGKLPAKVFEVLYFVVKYGSYLVVCLMLAVAILHTLGRGQFLRDAVQGAIVAHYGDAITVVIIVGIAYFVIRLLEVVFTDLKARTNLGPSVIDLFRNALKYLTYVVTGLILIIVVLSAVGQDKLGSNIVLLLTAFLGIMVSFAATGTVGNALAGLIIVGWRPFRRGDRVTVGGVYGDVLDFDILFTKVKTIEDEIVCVPSIVVLGTPIINYSGLARVLVKVPVTIGYEYDKDRVKELLVTAAKRTKGVLADPSPFVFVTDLSGSFVTYEIKGYTDKQSRLAVIASELREKVLETFSEAGVEILSPQHIIVDGDHLAVTGKSHGINRHVHGKGVAK